MPSITVHPVIAHRQSAVVLVLVAALATTGCTRALRSWEVADPILYANQDSGCAAGADGCLYPSGLLLAAWPDGRILRTESADTIGLRYVLGAPAAAQRDIVIAAVNRLEQIARVPERNSRPGATFHTVVIATAAGGARSWRIELPVTREEDAVVEEQLITLMQIELTDSRSIHWSELPRFDAPVIGDWRTVHHP